jgi:hypothetical protein
MKKSVLIMVSALIVLGGSVASTIDQWKTNDDLKAQVQGGETLTVYADMTKLLSIDESGVNKVYDAKLAASDVQDISMTSSSFLILVDKDGQQYTTRLEITNQLTLPSESNVVMNHDGEIQVEADDLSDPEVQWLTSLEFPEDLDLNGLGLNSNLEQTPGKDLESLDTYCEDRGIGYAAGCNIQFSESNNEAGIECNWGEKERVSVGSD